MQKSASYSNNASNASGSGLAYPPVLLAMPVIGAGVLISSVAIVTSNPPGYLPYIVVPLLFYWAYCLIRIHTVLQRETNSTYPIRPLEALMLGTIAGPLAPYLASHVMNVCLSVLGFVTREVGEVFPSDLPIMQSGIWLLSSNATLASIVIGTAVVLICQQRLALSLEGLVASLKGRNQASFSLSGLLLGICVATPACFWLLGSTSLSTSFGLEQDWQARLFLIEFLGLLGAYSIMSWWCHRLSSAFAGLPRTAKHRDVNPSPKNDATIPVTTENAA